MTLRAHPPTDIRIGGRSRRPPVLPLLLAASLAANAFFLLRWGPKEGEPDPSLAEAAAAVAAVESGEATPAPAAVANAAVAAAEVPPTASAAEAPPAAEPAEEAVEEAPADGLKSVHVVIDGAVSRGFVAALGDEEGTRLALTAERLLTWDLNLNRDARKGDTVDLLYRINPQDPVDITIEAMRYRSAKLGRDLEAWRYQPEGWDFPSWFDGEGREVPARLESSPIATYEQITSLIGDGRGHAGMDFKSPVGTPVVAPFAGQVVRTNWNWRFNGNCVEMRRPDGKLVRFLHLSEVDEGVKPGVSLKPGQPVGRSGNTGRSSAPHLHYEIRSPADKVLDPLDVHKTSHRRLDGPAAAAFQQAVGQLGERLPAQ